MRWPKRGILIRLAIYVPVISFVAWRYQGGCEQSERATKDDELEKKLAPHRKMITLPDGTQQEVVELTQDEAEQILGHPIPRDLDEMGEKPGGDAKGGGEVKAGGDVKAGAGGTTAEVKAGADATAIDATVVDAKAGTEATTKDAKAGTEATTKDAKAGADVKAGADAKPGAAASSVDAKAAEPRP